MSHRVGMNTEVRRPMVFVSGIFRIGSYCLLVKRQCEPFQGSWTLPTRLVVDGASPAQLLDEIASEYAGITVVDSRVIALDTCSFFQDGLRFNALQIVYTAVITNTSRPEIDMWGASHPSAAQMISMRQTPRPMGFGHEQYVELSRFGEM